MTDNVNLANHLLRPQSFTKFTLLIWITVANTPWCYRPFEYIWALLRSFIFSSYDMLISVCYCFPGLFDEPSYTCSELTIYWYKQIMPLNNATGLNVQMHLVIRPSASHSHASSYHSICEDFFPLIRSPSIFLGMQLLPLQIQLIAPIIPIWIALIRCH